MTTERKLVVGSLILTVCSLCSTSLQVKDELSRKAERRTTWLMWAGMAYMATQFGILARLTWWEYSWDIMEPVTYFITYGTAMAMYAYYVLTRQVKYTYKFKMSSDPLVCMFQTHSAQSGFEFNTR